MHKIVKLHLDKFVNDHSLEMHDTSKQFEMFVNYCMVAEQYYARFSVEDITNNGDDAGIDGIAFLIDGELVTSPEMAVDIFSKSKRNISAEVIFTQAKTSESFEKAQISNFGDGILDFLSDEPSLPQSEFLSKSKKIFEKILTNIGRIKDGRPIAKVYFVTTGNVEPTAREIIAAEKIIKKKVDDSGYFSEVKSHLTGRESLIKIYSEITNGVEATLKVNGYLPYPQIPGVEEAYIAIASAKDFVESLLNDDGKIRTHIFEENVRAYLGEENPINQEMKNTIEKDEKCNRFGILNNGITIISPDVRIQNNNIYLRNYQIVNGCQTSNVLFENREKLDNIVIPVKIVEAQDADVIDDIVKATNSQTKVEETQFLSSYGIIKSVEKYFAARRSENIETAIYLERRDRQHFGASIPEIRIVDIRTLCKGVAAMFFERPDLASRYPNQMIDEIGKNQILNERNKEIIYFASALARYRLDILMASQRIPSNLSKCKWHMLLMLKYIANSGKPAPALNSSKIESYCEKIIDACKDPEIRAIKKAADILTEMGEIDRDKLRLISFTGQLLSEVKQ